MGATQELHGLLASALGQCDEEGDAQERSDQQKNAAVKKHLETATVRHVLTVKEGLALRSCRIMVGRLTTRALTRHKRSEWSGAARSYTPTPSPPNPETLGRCPPCSDGSCQSTPYEPDTTPVWLAFAPATESTHRWSLAAVDPWL